MSSRIAFPFLTLTEAAVTAAPWMIGIVGGDMEPAGEYLPDWDAASSIRLTRTVLIDRDVAARDLEIEQDGLTLAVSLRVGTGPGRLPRLILFRESRPLPSAERQVSLEVELHGKDLSTVIDLQVEIFLGAAEGRTGELSPRRAGDRLWHQTHRVRLEGEEPRFPIEIADFRKLLGDAVAASSPWYLHWTPREWGRDFHGSMRLYLNSRHPEVVARVERQDPDILQALMADVMGQVCESLVREPEMQGLLDQCEAASLGAQASRWLQLAWPGRDLAHARSVLENRPGVFRAAFLALAEQQGGDA